MRVRASFLTVGCLLASGIGVAQILTGIGGATGVKGQPYSLVEKTTTVRTLEDGTTITRHQEIHQMRDAEGRQRTEIGFERDGVMQFNNANIFDPVAREQINLSIAMKMARIIHLPELKPMDPAKLAELKAKASENRANHLQQQSVNPPLIEKLGGQTMAGVYAEGTRVTRVIPAGKEGNDREIRSVVETWVSPDLKITVGRTSDDPRNGKTTMVVTDLNRGDPPALLFQVPADYKVIEPKRSNEAQ
jgi:hypothetical protein